jgi:hypothetical protein
MMRFERRWAQHLLAAFAPPSGEGLSPGPTEVDYLGVLARMRRQASPLAAFGLRIAVWVAALAPLWRWGRLATITKLATERRSELLRELLSPRLFAVRELTLLLKLCAAMALLGSPSVRARSGYDPLQSERPPSSARVRLPLAAGAEALRGASTPAEVTAAALEEVRRRSEMPPS